MIKKYNDYKCLALFRRRQCHCCCYPAYQSCWLIIPLSWHQFYGLWNASQCFHNAMQLGSSIHHWAGESLLIGWRADCHSPAEEGHGFWRSGHSDGGERNGGLWGCDVQEGPHRDTKLQTAPQPVTQDFSPEWRGEAYQKEKLHVKSRVGLPYDCQSKIQPNIS